MPSIRQRFHLSPCSDFRSHFSGSRADTDNGTLPPTLPSSEAQSATLLVDRDWRTCSAGPNRMPEPPCGPGGSDDFKLSSGSNPNQTGIIPKTILNGSSTPIFPGDYGEITWSFKNASSSASSSKLNVRFDDLKDVELACSPTEGPPVGPDPGPDCGPPSPPAVGELSSEVHVHIWKDPDCDNFFDPGEVSLFGADVAAPLTIPDVPPSGPLGPVGGPAGAFLAGGAVTYANVAAGFFPGGRIPPGGVFCIGMTWLYRDISGFPGNNITQTDELSFDVKGNLTGQ